ncbi:MAG: thioredoxin family protein [Anaerolineae bacterium]|nr:thioredoxin family protein [Anaerolineae bacterium]
MLTIKILGTGCPNCRRLEAETRAPLDALQPAIDYEPVKVTDIMEIAAYGVLSVPGLVLNETMICSGRIPKREQIAPSTVPVSAMGVSYRMCGYIVIGWNGLPSILAATPSRSLTLMPQPVLHCRHTE